jgi:Holliday junction resolvase RusA-like endonuclease
MTSTLYTAQDADPFDLMAGTMQRLEGLHLAGAAARAQEVADAAVRVAEVASLRNSASSAVTLTLPYPISANRYWAYRTVKPRGKPEFVSMYVTKEAKDYKRQVEQLARVAGVRAPIAGRVALELTLYPNRPQDWQTRMRKMGPAWDDSVQCLDLDNAQKVVLDSLKDIVFDDDAWVRQIVARRAEPDEFGARLMVKVVPMPVDTQQGTLL